MPDKPTKTDNSVLYNKEEEAVTKVSSFNFNNIFDLSSKQLGKLNAMDGKGTEKQNGVTTTATGILPSSTIGDNLRRRRHSSSSGDSDLVVLSVVLNKKQKENDEVAIAIERLRQNGVNCVFFTMNDIRNGSKKPETEISDAFRLSSSSASKDASKLQSMQRLPILPSIKCEETSDNSNESSDSNSSLAIHESVEKVINSFSTSPSPSPPPLSPQHQLLSSSKNAVAASAKSQIPTPSLSSLLSPIISESTLPLLHTDRSSIVQPLNPPDSLLDSQSSNLCSSSQIDSNSTANSTATTTNTNNIAKKRKRRLRKPYTHRKTQLKKKLKEMAAAARSARANGINNMKTSLPSSTTNATVPATITSIPTIVTTTEISQDIVYNGTKGKKSKSQKKNKKTKSSVEDEPESLTNEQSTTTITKNKTLDNEHINFNTTTTSSSTSTVIKRRAEPSFNPNISLKVTIDPPPETTGETDVTTTTTTNLMTVKRINNLSPDVSFAVSEKFVNKKKKSKAMPNKSSLIAATVPSSSSFSLSSSSSSLLTIPDTVIGYNSKGGGETSVSSSTSVEERKNNSTNNVNAVTSIQFNKSRAFSPDITFEKKRLPQKAQQSNNTNNSSNSSDSVLNSIVVTNRKTKIGRKQPNNSNNIAREALNCVQVEMISNEIKVQLKDEENKVGKKDDVEQTVKDEEKEHFEKKVMPDDILKVELTVKPKKKKRGKRNRLVFRKGAASKKKSKSKTKKEKTSLNIPDIDETTLAMPTTTTTPVFVPSIDQVDANDNDSPCSNSSKRPKMCDSVSIGQDQPMNLKEEDIQSSVSFSTDNDNNVFNMLSASIIVDTSKKGKKIVINQDQIANQNCSLVIKNERITATLDENQDSNSNVVGSIESTTITTTTTTTSNNAELEGSGNKTTTPVPIPGSFKCSEDSLPDIPDAMQLRRSSFYSLVSGNVRTNLENYLDGRISLKSPNRRRKRAKNGFLLHHGDNFPEDPEAPYKLHLATQVLLKLNKRRAKFKPKEDRGKSLLSYLKLVPKRTPRNGKPNPTPPTEEPKIQNDIPAPIFSGEWSLSRKYICGVCGQVEDDFWAMVCHKGEVHPGVVCTHTELAGLPPPSLVRRYPIEDIQPNNSTFLSPPPPPCTKCSATFSTIPDLHRHIFECAGNAAWLETEKVSGKRKPKRRRGFKRRLSNTPKKVNAKRTDSSSKRRPTTAEVFKCEFCSKSYKNQGWLKVHLASHSLPVSIPLKKISLPSRASFNSLSCQLFQ